MKKVPRTGLAILLLASMVYSCKDAAPSSEEAATEMTESIDSSSVVSSSAAVVNKKDTRKFIRTADIKFKVKNVAKSTYAIEDATTKFGGYVAATNLQSQINEKETTKVSQDSTLISTKYNVTNEITIRVPNTRLDTVIKTIAKQIDFLDYRIIKAEDVSLQMLSNVLAQNRSQISEKRIAKAIDTKGKKLDNILNAEETLENKKEQSDNATVENLKWKDQVNFSTLTVSLYQNEAVKQELIANQKSVNAYRPNIGLQIWDSIKTGWFMLEAIIAFVVQLWGIALLFLLIWFGIKKWKK